MRKILAYALCVVLTLSSCSSTGEGAYMGSQIGAVLGSAIGGISGGWRGSDIGTVVGMAGGAVAGAAIGSANEKARIKDYERERNERLQRRHDDMMQVQNRQVHISDRPVQAEERQIHVTAGEDVYGTTGNIGVGSADDSGFDPTHSGDDRITFDTDDSATFGSDDSATFDSDNQAQHSTELSVGQLGNLNRDSRKFALRPALEVRRVTFTDADGDGRIGSGEECKVSFEIMNNTRKVMHNLRPFVTDTTGNKRIIISQSILVESIAPGTGVRYTATVLGGRKLKDGTAVLRVGVEHDGHEVSAENELLTIATHRR